jgi:hypothetical protein
MKMAVVASLLLVSVQTTSAQYYDRHGRAQHEGMRHSR